jgi:hypothetical protein
LFNGQEFIGLDDLAALLMLAVREDALAGGVTVTYKGRTVVASADQAMASVNGRVVTLPAPIARAGRRLLVPLDFIPRAIAPIYDSPIELRRASRLLMVGNVRVPRAAIRVEAAGPPTRLTVDIVPPFAVSTAFDAGRVLVRVDADALDIATTPTGAGLIDQIRTGEQTTTIAIALNTRAGTPRISTTTTNESTRVLVEVPVAAQQETVAPAPAPGPSSSARPGGDAAPPARHPHGEAADDGRRCRPTGAKITASAARRGRSKSKSHSTPHAG